MKSTWFLSTIFLISIHKCFSIVFNKFNELEKLYFDRKVAAEKNQNENDPFIKLSEKHKEDLCEETLNTPYFLQVKFEEYANKNSKSVFKMVSTDENALNFHYRIKDKNGPKKLKNFEPIYPYDLRFLGNLQGQHFSQRMFPCLARTRVSRTLVLYYISYGFMAGERFLFRHHPHDGRIVVDGLIENSPTWVPFNENRKLQEFYVKQNEVTATNPDLEYQIDPICDLQDFEKLRLCSLVFSTEFYLKTVKFTAHLNNVDCACENVKINVDEDLGKNLKDNVIGCHVRVKNGPWVIYKLSYGFNGEASVFVFQTIVLQNSNFSLLLNFSSTNDIHILDGYIRGITVLQERDPEMNRERDVTQSYKFESPYDESVLLVDSS